MLQASRGIEKSKHPAVRVIAWLIAGVAACLLGTMAWLTALLFFVVGATIIHVLGLNAPGWVGWLALLGAPLGAWLEIRFT